MDASLQYLAMPAASLDIGSSPIDVAFHVGALADSNCVARRIFTCHGGLLASPAYLPANGMPGNLRELAGHECVTQPPETDNCAVWRLQGPDGMEEERLAKHHSAIPLKLSS
ncbi:MAG TPA: hypothetical protein VF555_25105 [Variovorax sp.]